MVSRPLHSGSDQGSNILEYGAVVLLVAAILAALLAGNLPNRIKNAYSTALCLVSDELSGECEDTPASSDGGPAQASSPSSSETVPANRTPVPSDREADPDSTWPYQIVPDSYPAEQEEKEEKDKPGSGSDSDLITSGTLPPEESPLYTDPGEYPQMHGVEESAADYQSLGEGKTPKYLLCAPWDDMCCPEDTCTIIKNLHRSADLARIACLRPGEKWAYCRPNAADYLDHFVNGSGEDIDLDMDVFLKEVPEFQEEIELDQQDLIENALKEAELRDIDGPLTIPISTEKKGWGYPEENVNGAGFVYDNPDWANAIGSFHYWMEGEVTVYPPDRPGGDFRYELDTSVSMEKWYDWERDNTEPVFDD